jgi:hypothetical protein
MVISDILENLESAGILHLLAKSSDEQLSAIGKTEWNWWCMVFAFMSGFVISFPSCLMNEIPW